MVSYKEIKKELDFCNNPVFFFDDDPDGLSSFIQFYKYKKQGKGTVVKSSPALPGAYSSGIGEENDKIFILDKPMVEKGFFEAAYSRKLPVVWIDHHEPQLFPDSVKYFNPRINGGKNIPVSQVCYNAVKESQWIAAIGIIGDWFIPPFLKELALQFPDLISSRIKAPEQALFNTPFGRLVKIFSFNLKGTKREIDKSLEALIKVESPYVVLSQSTPEGKYVYKRFWRVNEEYEFHLRTASASVSSKDQILFYIYDSSQSFTSDISNELLFRFPKKVIIVGKEKRGYVRLSVRSSVFILPKMLEKALEGLDGYSGGHEHACGANVRLDQVDQFLNNLKKELKA
ncbi:MAG TPA: DHH family phosphoesterase [Candidatus Woesearchaeota archaeon]|nr:DHH family phosphoesterase [Candidatus Woesearchaeota archaeon]